MFLCVNGLTHFNLVMNEFVFWKAIRFYGDLKLLSKQTKLYLKLFILFAFIMWEIFKYSQCDMLRNMNNTFMFYLLAYGNDSFIILKFFLRLFSNNTFYSIPSLLKLSNMITFFFVKIKLTN